MTNAEVIKALGLPVGYTPLTTEWAKTRYNDWAYRAIPNAPNFTWHEFLTTSHAPALTNRQYATQFAPTLDILVNIQALAIQLQKLRNQINRKAKATLGAKYRPIALLITSGYRSPRVNTLAKGKALSAHKLGLAADIKVAGYTNNDIAYTAKEVGFKRFGWANTYMHLDIAGYENYKNLNYYAVPAVWTYTSTTQSNRLLARQFKTQLLAA